MIADSSLLIDFLREKKNAVEMIQKYLAEGIYTTEVNVFELVRGAYLSRNPEIYIERVHVLLSRMVVLPLERRATLKAGELAAFLDKEGLHVEDADCLIAGIALVNSVPIIGTLNKSHFERFPGIKVITY